MSCHCEIKHHGIDVHALSHTLTGFGGGVSIVTLEVVEDVIDEGVTDMLNVVGKVIDEGDPNTGTMSDVVGDAGETVVEVGVPKEMLAEEKDGPLAGGSWKRGSGHMSGGIQPTEAWSPVCSVDKSHAMISIRTSFSPVLKIFWSITVGCRQSGDGRSLIRAAEEIHCVSGCRSPGTNSSLTHGDPKSRKE